MRVYDTPVMRRIGEVARDLAEVEQQRILDYLVKSLLTQDITEDDLTNSVEYAKSRSYYMGIADIVDFLTTGRATEGVGEIAKVIMENKAAEND